MKIWKINTPCHCFHCQTSIENKQLRFIYVGHECFISCEDCYESQLKNKADKTWKYSDKIILERITIKCQICERGDKELRWVKLYPGLVERAYCRMCFFFIQQSKEMSPETQELLNKINWKKLEVVVQ